MSQVPVSTPTTPAASSLMADPGFIMAAMAPLLSQFAPLQANSTAPESVGVNASPSDAFAPDLMQVLSAGLMTPSSAVPPPMAAVPAVLQHVDMGPHTPALSTSPTSSTTPTSAPPRGPSDAPAGVPQAAAHNPGTRSGSHVMGQDVTSTCAFDQEDPSLRRTLAAAPFVGAPNAGAPFEAAPGLPMAFAPPQQPDMDGAPVVLGNLDLRALQTGDADAALKRFMNGMAPGWPPAHTADSAALPGTSTVSTTQSAQPSGARPLVTSPSSDQGFTALEVEAIRQDFPILHQKVNGHPLAWLDNAATTQKPRQVMAALDQFYERDNSNIHRAAHTLAARATDAYEAARVKVQRFLKAKSEKEIVFVRGTTEAINLVAQSHGRANVGKGDEILVTTLEHHANIVPWQMLCAETGAVLRPIPITEMGEVDLAAYAQMLSPRVKFVSLAHVSNVLGTVVPVQEMTAMAHGVGARVLVDGAQAVAHLPVDVCQIGCDFYVFSGHKIFGPTGVGALYGRYELLDAMPPWQGGGNMIDQVTFTHTTYSPPPAKFEAGTATLADAVGLGVALDYLNAVGLERAANHEQALLRAATAGLSAIAGLRIYGNSAHKAAVVSFLIDGIAADTIGKKLDQAGIAVRTGHHCAQPTMQRYGVKNMVRPSFALYNTFDEVDRLVRVVQRIRHEHR